MPSTPHRPAAGRDPTATLRRGHREHHDRLPGAPAPERRPMAVLRRTLAWAAILVLAVAVVGASSASLVAGRPGLVGALIGAVMAGVFLGVTAAQHPRREPLDLADYSTRSSSPWCSARWFAEVRAVHRGRDGARASSRGCNLVVAVRHVIVGVLGSLVIDCSSSRARAWLRQRRRRSLPERRLERCPVRPSGRSDATSRAPCIAVIRSSLVDRSSRATPCHGMPPHRRRLSAPHRFASLA